MTDFWRLVFPSIIWSLATLSDTLITFRENHWLLRLIWRFSESVFEYESVFRICVWIIIHKLFYSIKVDWKKEFLKKNYFEMGNVVSTVSISSFICSSNTGEYFEKIVQILRFPNHLYIQFVFFSLNIHILYSKE